MCKVRAEKALRRVREFGGVDHELDGGLLVVFSECPRLPLPIASANLVEVERLKGPAGSLHFGGTWLGL